jgi:carboxymethylenebutenolidase
MCHDSCPKPVTGGAPVTESMTTVSRDDAEIPVLLVRPDDAAPAPGIVLIHDIHGANDFYHDIARRLAQAGYVAALPNLFHREGPPAGEGRQAVLARSQKAKQANQLGDLEAVATWLLGEDGCDGTFGVVGFCMGGTLTFRMAAREPRPAAGVAFYGFPAKAATANAPIRPIDTEEVAAVAAPLLGIWGEEDSGVGMDNVDAYADALVAAGKPHDILVYPEVGHGFLTFDEDAPGYGPSSHAWDKALAFLKRHLQTREPAS